MSRADAGIPSFPVAMALAFCRMGISNWRTEEIAGRAFRMTDVAVPVNITVQ